MRILIILFLILQSGFAQSQNNTHNLSGYIFSEQDKEPLIGATILLVGEERGVSADKEGFFEIKNLSAGSYQIEARFIGFKSRTMSVLVPLNKPIEIFLKPDLIRSEDIIVTSSPAGRNVQYQPAQAFSREELQKRAAPSIGEMLDGSPGVSMRSFGSAPSRPVIRGLDGDRVLILQNGERMGDLSETAADHAIAMEPLAAERIEVVRGPASLLYGSSAIGGVINVFSHDLPRDWDPGTSGSFSTQGATVNRLGAGLLQMQQGSENWAFSGRGSFREAGNVRTPSGLLPQSFLSSNDFAAGSGYRKDQFQTGAALSVMNLDYGLPEGFDNSDERVELNTTRYQFQNISSRKFDGFLNEAELRIQTNHYDHAELVFSGLTTGQEDLSLGLTFEQTSVSSSFTVTNGKKGAIESGAFGISGFWRDLNVGGEEALTPDAQNFFLAGFLFEEFGLNDLVTLQTGTRLEFRKMVPQTNELFRDLSLFDERNDLIFSGSVGLNVKPLQNLEIGTQFARAFRTPTVEELFSNSPHPGNGTFDVGDPNLENETSLGMDLFIRYSSSRWSFEAAGFANRIDNFVKFTPTGEVDERSDLPVFEYSPADALLAGFEFTSVVQLSDRWKSSLIVDFVRGRERGSEQNPLPFMPPLRTTFELNYDQGNWWAESKLRIVDSQNRVAPDEETTAGYALLGLKAGYRFEAYGNQSVILRLDNAFNEKYRDHLTRIEDRNNPMPGRNVNLVWQWSF